MSFKLVLGARSGIPFFLNTNLKLYLLNMRSFSVLVDQEGMLNQSYNSKSCHLTLLVVFPYVLHIPSSDPQHPSDFFVTTGWAKKTTKKTTCHQQVVLCWRVASTVSNYCRCVKLLSTTWQQNCFLRTVLDTARMQ